jgi:AraC-like DNA-binding protein
MPSNHATARLLEGHDAALQTMLRKAELAACIERQVPHEWQLRTAIHQLTLVRVNRVAHPVFTVCEPAVCLLARGSKRLVLADEAYVYDPDTYLVASQHLPVSGQVIDASPELPYLALRLNYDATDVASLLAGMRKHKRPIGQATSRGIATADVTPALLDAVLRLVRLLDTPQDIQALAPLTFREVLYRVLTGPCGTQLAQLSATDGPTRRVCNAMGWIRRHYDRPLDMSAMAAMAELSISALRTNFKAATAMSPHQYQKDLRLLEARRMLLGGWDAASAGHRVGYESASQFSREYARKFGAAPAKDVRRFRQQHGGAEPDPRTATGKGS